MLLQMWPTASLIASALYSENGSVLASLFHDPNYSGHKIIPLY